MEPDRAIEIVQSLADGVNPFTDERFPSTSPYQQADTVRALHLALEAMTKVTSSMPPESLLYCTSSLST
ncbi:MAG: hypothetical protein KJ626_07850 [Verrucomicrobia bacterium]|nr:hypothetical protein [Verrucomicrobiota bacterium]